MIKTEKLLDSTGNVINIHPDVSDIVTLKTAGNVLEIKYASHLSSGGTTKKLSKTEYIDTRTGEVKQFNTQQRRSDDLKSVYRSIEAGRDLIRANCTDARKCRFITLTYADNMTDTKKLNNDFKNFLKRLPKDISPDRWITAVEPQRRGAWHIHLIAIFDREAPYIENSTVSKAWGHGFVSIRSVDSCDDMGAYLCAYLTDLDIGESESTDGKKIKVIEDENGIPKRVVKGGRLHMYPSGMHIFRKSKNCYLPSREKLVSSEAEKRVSGLSLVYESTKRISETETSFENIINTRVYNKIRKETNDSHRVFHTMA